ncbi:MAG: hypothetical protein ABI417_08785, partial [Coleofasciculaceae cyanobacterium]
MEPGYQNQPVTAPEVTPNEIPAPEVTPDEIPAPEIPIQPALPEIEATPSETQPSKPKSGGFFGRFQRQSETAKPSPEVIVPEEPLIFEPEVIQTPEQVPTPLEELPASSESIPQEPETQKPKPGGFFGRFGRQPETAKPSPEVIVPEVIQTPDQVPTPVEELQPEVIPTSEQVPTPVEELPKNSESIPQEPQKSKPGGFFGRFRRPTEAPQPSLQRLIEEVPSPEPTTLPEILPLETKEIPEQPQEVVPKPVLIEKAPTPVIPETPQPKDEAATKPKIDLKEVFLSPPAPAPRIIQAPNLES